MNNKQKLKWIRNTIMRYVNSIYSKSFSRKRIIILILLSMALHFLVQKRKQKKEQELQKFHPIEQNEKFRDQLNKLVIRNPEISKCQIDPNCDFMWIRKEGQIDYYCPLCDEWDEILVGQTQECEYNQNQIQFKLISQT